MHFPDLWYFESVLRSWINANVSMGSQCSLVPKGTTNGQFRASSSTTKCDLLPTMNRTVTLSFRNVSVRRHLVKFAATVAANLVQTLAWNQNPNCSLFDPIEEFAPHRRSRFFLSCHQSIRLEVDSLAGIIGSGSHHLAIFSRTSLSMCTQSSELFWIFRGSSAWSFASVAA